MPSRITQLMQLLEEARDKGDTDKITEIETELFQMKKKDGGAIEGDVELKKGGGYIQDLL